MGSPLLVDVTDCLRLMLAEATSVRLPNARYRQDPVSFFREVLGIEPWSEQVKALEALRDHDRVAWKSGRRVSKSNTVGGAPLWWYSSDETLQARVIVTAPTARQVDAIIWRELSMLRAKAGRCITCKEQDPFGRRITAPCPHSALIGGEIGELARTGLRAKVEGDFREVVGFTARTGEAFQGYAGPDMLFLADEASGIGQAIFDVITGNLAGGGKLMLTGNPTQNSGEFYDAFHSRKLDLSDPEGIGYFTMTTSSEQSPNVVANKIVVPGLATARYIREREAEWGRDSSMFKIHVLGEFAENEEGRIFSVAVIDAATRRWQQRIEDMEELSVKTPAKVPDYLRALGRLYVGLDPAGATGTGDDTSLCFRRGDHAFKFEKRRGLDAEQHLILLLALLSQKRLPREVPVVVLDASGSIGAELAGRLRAHAEMHPEDFKLVALRASDRAVRQPHVHDRIRDDLTANLEAWLRSGGEIPADSKLPQEMYVMEWETGANGKQKVTAKTKIKKELGRSPDGYDSLALACWEPLSIRQEEAAAAEPPPPENPHEGRIDPYGGTIDPYGDGGFR